MKIAIIEPYLVDYTGHYYNFVTELRRGFNKIDDTDVVDIFVPKNTKINKPYFKILPEIKNLGDKCFPIKIFEHVLLIIKLYNSLMKIAKEHDLLFLPSIDDWRIFFTAFILNTNKPVVMYIHNISLDTKQKLILKHLAWRKKNKYLLSAVEKEDVPDDLINFLKSKGFKMILGVPYPLSLPEYSGLSSKLDNNFYISYLGGAKKDKGFIDVVKFVFYSQDSKLDYNFIIQVNAPSLGWEKDVEEIVKLLKSVNLPNVTIIDCNLTTEEYFKKITDSSILLLLYEPQRYKTSISAILLEALYFGKPVIVRNGSWLAKQVSKYGGGIVVVDPLPETIRDAVERIKIEYEKYSSDAFKAGQVLYKRHNGVKLAELLKMCAKGI